MSPCRVCPLFPYALCLICSKGEDNGNDSHGTHACVTDVFCSALAHVSHTGCDIHFLAVPVCLQKARLRILLPVPHGMLAVTVVESLIFTVMEIVNVEKRTFEDFMDRIEMFVEKVENLCDRGRTKPMSAWLDNQDVCLILNISPRTLQSMRDRGTLAYSQISHKIFYKAEDVHRLVSSAGEGKLNR